MGQKENEPEDVQLSEDLCFQLHIFHLSKQLINEMSDLISTQTTSEKLEELS